MDTPNSQRSHATLTYTWIWHYGGKGVVGRFATTSQWVWLGTCHGRRPSYRRCTRSVTQQPIYGAAQLAMLMLGALPYTPPSRSPGPAHVSLSYTMLLPFLVAQSRPHGSLLSPCNPAFCVHAALKSLSCSSECFCRSTFGTLPSPQYVLVHSFEDNSHSQINTTLRSFFTTGLAADSWLTSNSTLA